MRRMTAKEREALVTKTMRPFQRGVWADGEAFAKYTAEQRRSYARRGIALPDGSFPIPNCAAAEDAIHAQGRTGGSAGRVRAHIRKRVRALGCSGAIFESYK